MQEHKFAVDENGWLWRSRNDGKDWFTQGCKEHYGRSCKDGCPFFWVYPGEKGKKLRHTNVRFKDKPIRVILCCAHDDLTIPLESAYEELK